MNKSEWASQKILEESTNDVPVQSLDELKDKVIAELKEQAAAKDTQYDPEHEKEIERRLSVLDEQARENFYLIRNNRESNGILSKKDLDLLTLEAIELSFDRSQKK